MDYKIINFDKKLGMITVLYDEISNYKLTLMVPIVDNKFIVGDVLHEFIQSFSSQNNELRKNDIENVLNLNELESLVDIDGFTSYLREKRNELLLATDYTQVLDFDEAKRSIYAVYRQKLRDLPESSGFPLNIIWPELISKSS